MTIVSLSKKCCRCGAEKQALDFAKSKSKKDGLRYACKVCEYAANAEYRAANREKLRVYSAVYKKENADKIKAASVVYKAANPDKVKPSTEKVKAYRVANAVKKRKSDNAWRLANPDARRRHDHNRRAKQRADGGTLSKGLSARLFKLQKGLCPCCAKPLGENYHLDHILPIYLGGVNADWNIQLLRQRCNNQKHAKHPVDFMQERGFLL